MHWSLSLLLAGFAGPRLSQTQYNLRPAPAGSPGPEALSGGLGYGGPMRARRSGRRDGPRLYPCNISREWIRQGSIDCYLNARERFRRRGYPGFCRRPVRRGQPAGIPLDIGAARATLANSLVAGFQHSPATGLQNGMNLRSCLKIARSRGGK